MRSFTSFCRFIAPLFLVAGPFVATVAATDLPVDEIMRRNFYVAKIKTVTSDATMLLITDKGQTRERRITSLSALQGDGADVNLVVRFEQPADVRGTTFLQIQHAQRDDDMWIYLPALRRSRRLVANNKRDSFVGSDFSYADILPLKPGLFRHTLLRDETLDGRECYVVESVPGDGALQNDLGYSKKISWIRRDNFVETKVDYYDADGNLLKTQTTAEHRQVQQEPPRWLAWRREMIDRQTGHRTVITLNNIDTNKLVATRAFTVEAIERD